MHTTPRRPKGFTVDLSTQPFRVAHQKIAVDLDLARNTLAGFTEITVIPTDPHLKNIKLDCRGLAVKNVWVNNRKTSFRHADQLNIFRDDLHFEQPAARAPETYTYFGPNSRHIGIHQHQLVKTRLHYLFQEGNTEELTVVMPERLKITLRDSAQFSSLTPMRDSPRTPQTGEYIYTPLTVKVEYACHNPKTGLNFISGELSARPRAQWHAYTTNSEYNIATSSWVPCVDNLWERCTWLVEIAIPRTVMDIGTSARASETSANISRGDRASARSHARGSARTASEEAATLTSDEVLEVSDEDDNWELILCCGDHHAKETPHADLSKKLVSWQLFSPVAAHHVGWAVGPFNAISFPSLNEDETDDKDAGSVPATIYCLPEASEAALNTCVFMSKAIDFFSKEFGSFPFSSYAVCFVAEPACESAAFAGLSVVSDKVLYTPDLLEPMFPSTETLLHTLTNQWSGVNLVPRTSDDIWVVIGISHYMSLQYIRQLMGQNEYKFRVKRQADQICEEDVGKRPLADQFWSYPLSDKDFGFLKLKAPIVLFILDKRMTKTDKSFGLSRALPKLFLQAMLGDLPNGSLSTAHFQHICEKVAHHKMEAFFRQWVYRAGVPVFQVSQKFNKKRMFIEMTIKQVQAMDATEGHSHFATFLRDAVAHIEDEHVYPVQPVFTGPMTIRIHEADGTPYEHIVDLKEGTTKLDIQYNTKYRRTKKLHKELSRDARVKAAAREDTRGEARDPDAALFDEHGNVIHRLGDVLLLPAECREWGLVEWPKEEEERMANEAFEWIRVDADFEWICKTAVAQPEYMFASQLQQDRDVEAQFDALRFFRERKPSTLFATLLTRTVMDTRYYYAIRTEAARTLAGYAKEENGYLGLRFLLHIFRARFCFRDSDIPMTNDFTDFSDFWLKKQVPGYLALIKDNQGNCPNEVKCFLLSLLRYNDNISNPFNDCFYVADLIRALATSIANPYHARAADACDDHFAEILAEINRMRELDILLPSYQKIISLTALTEKLKLARHGHIKLPFAELLHFTQPTFDDAIRLVAFEALLSLGALKNAAVLRYFFVTAFGEAASPYFRARLVDAFVTSIGMAAVHGTPLMLDDPEFHAPAARDPDKDSNVGSLIVVEDGAQAELSARRDAHARATLDGSIEILRRDYARGRGLRKFLWKCLHTTMLSLREKRDLFGVCQVLYRSVDSFTISLGIPNVEAKDLMKKIVAKDLGGGKVVVRREGRFKIQLFTKLVKPKEKLVLSLGKGETNPGAEKLAITEAIPALSVTPLSAFVPTDASATPDAKSEPKIKFKLGVKKAAEPVVSEMKEDSPGVEEPKSETVELSAVIKSLREKKPARESKRTKTQKVELALETPNADGAFELATPVRMLEPKESHKESAERKEPALELGPAVLATSKLVESPKKVQDSSKALVPLVLFSKKFRRFDVVFKLLAQKLASVTDKRPMVLSEILRSLPGELRYVKLSLREKKVTVSTELFRPKTEPKTETRVSVVTLKTRKPEKWEVDPLPEKPLSRKVSPEVSPEALPLPKKIKLGFKIKAPVMVDGDNVLALSKATPTPSPPPPSGSPPPPPPSNGTKPPPAGPPPPPPPPGVAPPKSKSPTSGSESPEGDTFRTKTKKASFRPSVGYDDDRRGSRSPTPTGMDHPREKRKGLLEPRRDGKTGR
ncbi:hypothetical protein BABINDRAFT_166616 [Babjeviella inositovora NRRL Y-12698]|uniref:Transcription initiation factor TFIID subunit 2 n=1 Tax=Babjeviella inositovora NRRL Y-12698 TaxID=984486 RepID=A0A1E3QRE3_9ASCO|nr:uncharacterized protein BABINDRAFT_166616 [Babjeviella inositovora NRRL Y-12698]ODQ80265.1 hypothetical protein BABINDRAFT_166616 [Babjeviella inositovora NRRL Y-12698]